MTKEITLRSGRKINYTISDKGYQINLGRDGSNYSDAELNQACTLIEDLEGLVNPDNPD